LRVINRVQVPGRSETAFTTWFAEPAAREAQEKEQRAARRYLEWLPRRERVVVCRTMGFGGKEMSFEEIASRLKTTPAKVEQIYIKAIDSLIQQSIDLSHFAMSLQSKGLRVH
jgi:DNA-directed RNA polymerase sigma subunit (sigma70/sigma32)